ncbi:WD repeat and SOCS box-containing protein 2, partial [Dryobates pubescens]
CKSSERKSRGGKAEARSRGAAKEKTLECGQIVWGLAFSAWPAAEAGGTEPTCTVGLPCLILATGLNDGQIKVWEVQTGHLLFSLLGHQDVVRDLSFAPNGSLILVSASRDKTLRVWDLSRDGRQIQVLSGHVQWVYCCSISPDCSMLCSVAGEKSVSLSGRELSCVPLNLGLPFLLPSPHQEKGTGPPPFWFCTESWNVRGWKRHPEISNPSPLPEQDLLGQVPQKHIQAGLEILREGDSTTCLGSLLQGFSTFTPKKVSSPCLPRLLRIWALELRSPVAFAPMTNGLCCIYFPHGGFIATGTRDGHVQFWTAPRVLSSLKHLCRRALRTFLTTYQVLALPIPKKLKEFLTYRTF